VAYRCPLRRRIRRRSTNWLAARTLRAPNLRAVSRLGERRIAIPFTPWQLKSFVEVKRPAE